MDVFPPAETDSTAQAVAARPLERVKSWQHLTAPRPADWVAAGQLADDWDFAQDILDPDERSWLRREQGRVFLTLQFPVSGPGEDVWTLRPLGVVLHQQNLTTVLAEELPTLSPFFAQMEHLSSPPESIEILAAILKILARSYEEALQQLNQAIHDNEQQLDWTQSNGDFFTLLEISKSLTRFEVALVGNIATAFKISRLAEIRDDLPATRQVDTALLELQVAHERARVYAGTSTSMMDAYAGMVQNNINHGLKVVTVLAMVFYVPSMFATLYGVNTTLPFQKTHWIFWVILLLGLSIAGGLAAFFKRKGWI
ncbi:magnesium transporter CorA family protein [Acidithiobacillus montserratensis]|uniref:Magnesium transporter CorA family protein n=1 Tax=Acidithiobacillus montserratensis TaxID=2729135 RepID=A0ACD5HH59_9PROT|nr:magnesium transporter CorA family protein [Acidithiobacillus montserratensis]MBN2680280.1 magnesium transporter CorA family protein [Acidithiobacillaceae bacterium]MBU2748903.1 magnesium transporter CorA family protein [Acidithiobacillus montserratensis]